MSNILTDLKSEILGFFINKSRNARKHPIRFILLGLLGVGIALFFSFLSRSAKGYFLPSLFSTSILLVACLISLIIRKPLAAWLSHITRGWPTEWFWRADIKPAYMEVTFFWGLFLTTKLIILIYVYLNSSSSVAVITNVVTGTPGTLFALSATYIYGVLRLRQLKGPSVEEHMNHISKPWIGQKKGF
jgi:hypothetical protein